MEKNKNLDAACDRVKQSIDTRKAPPEDVCLAMIAAYREAQNHGNELLEFGRIWIWQVEEIANALKKFKIDQFALRCDYPRVIETICAFQQFGFMVDGVVRIFATCTDAGDDIAGHRPQVLAFRLTAKPSAKGVCGHA